jgi:hypothetical protein
MAKKEETKKKKEGISKVKYDKQGRYIFLRLSLVGKHEAIGILEDVKQDILHLVRAPRIAYAQKKEIEDRARRLALTGKDPMGKGLKKSKLLE